MTLRYEEGGRVYHRLYYQNNKDRLRQNCKNYVLTHNDKVNEYNRKYYHKNRDKVKAWHRRYYQQNKEKITQRRKEPRETRETIKPKQRDLKTYIIEGLTYLYF